MRKGQPYKISVSCVKNMIAFEIEINRKKYRLAGMEDWDLISTTLIVRRVQKENEVDEFELNVGGLGQQKVENQYEHVR